MSIFSSKFNKSDFLNLEFELNELKSKFMLNVRNDQIVILDNWNWVESDKKPYLNIQLQYSNQVSDNIVSNFHVESIDELECFIRNFKKWRSNFLSIYNQFNKFGFELAPISVKK